jgi:DNA-directed RNA polymerase specialized sigma24 family protein
MEHDILAFGQGLVAARPRLRRSALGLVGLGDQARALVQRTISQAWRQRDDFAPGQDLDDWLQNILRDEISEPRSFRGDH